MRGLRVYLFAVGVLACSGLGLAFPSWFAQWGDIRVRDLILPCTQLIMFGMGATLRVEDFRRVLHLPRAVLAGATLQFTIMPLAGWIIASLSGFPPEIAAGIILIGACPGGMASNVMTHVARGKVALSVTMTAFSTLLAPVLTPLAMQLLAGRLVPVDTFQMMLGILRLVIVPVGLGLLVNTLCQRRRWLMAVFLPRLSMFLVCFTLALIAAEVRPGLWIAGWALVAAAVVHNLAGLVLGYGAARTLRLEESTRRTVALEVGLQNGGMGVALALGVLHSPEAALAPGIFAVVMNFTGALLASWWSGRPVPIAP